MHEYARRFLWRSQFSLTSLIQAVTVAEYLNFRHAANALGVSQSSVSTRIRVLEQDLGILLFERRHRGVRLTEAGRSFVEEVAVGIEHFDLAIKTAGAVSSGKVGSLAIGLHSSLAGGFLVNLRGRFRADYPDVEQLVTEGRSSETIAMVRDGKLDVAFVLGVVDPSDCHARQLWGERFIVVLPTTHPMAAAEFVGWRDLATGTFLVRHGGPGPQLEDHIVRRLSRIGQAPLIRRCDVGRDTLMHMIAAGEGVTLTTEAASHVAIPGVVFRTIADEPGLAGFSAVWSPHNRSPALTNLLNLANMMSRSIRTAEIRTS